MRFSLESEELSDIEILLFSDVRNANDVRSQLLTGAVPAALLNASLVPDIFLVLIASQRALRKRRDMSMSTRNVFTEIVYNFSGTRNISKALQTFGIGADSKALLAVIPDATEEHVATVRKAIHGVEHDPTPEALQQVSDLPLIEKIYGISETEKRVGSLVDAIATRMACRDVK